MYAASSKPQDVPIQSGVAALVPQPAARENELDCYLKSGYRESSCFRLRVGGVWVSQETNSWIPFACFELRSENSFRAVCCWTKRKRS
jgi:hypothetical protein